MALRAKFSEVVTVADTAIGITSTNLVDSSGRWLDVHMAVFQHYSGGEIHVNAANTPVAGAGDDMSRILGDEWEVWGADDLQNFNMIRVTANTVTTTVVVQGYGV